MLQKEVAVRLTADCNTKEYGIPTVLLGECATVKKLMLLKPSEFHPKPKVDSLVIEIVFVDKDNWCNTNEKHFFFNQTVRAAFSQRRKTLLNTLSTIPYIQKEKKEDRKKMITEALHLSNIESSRRAETLSVEEFLRISSSLYEIVINR